jgi:hypothetical protein
VFAKVETKGFVCVARRRESRGRFEELFAAWPGDFDEVAGFVDSVLLTHEVYFCPMLLDDRERRKPHVVTCPVLWSDLDECEPGELEVPASFVMETSPGRYQALWSLEEPAEPADAENMTRRIAYHLRSKGADASGWDLTQLVRLPYTFNHKYREPAAIDLTEVGGAPVSLAEMRQVFPELAGYTWESVEYPTDLLDGDTVMASYSSRLDGGMMRLIQSEPLQDWSASLWALEKGLAERGLDRDEIFAVARGSACNKYARDNRSDHMLWREVCKAWGEHNGNGRMNGLGLGLEHFEVYADPELLDDDALRQAGDDHTYIEEYIDWAKTTGDAAPQYHQAGAFSTLSAVLSGFLHLETSFGTIIPNLWFLLLADTTLTRKSTALDLAVDIAMEVDDDVVMATDGSMEGLFSALSQRPARPSIFLRDEFSGLLDSMVRKDYYAGFAEVLTKLYDGKFQKRQLRREVIEIKEPVLLFLAGGTKARVFHLLTIEHVICGFLPRFVVITAQSDLSKLQPLRAPSDETREGRSALIKRLTTMKRAFAAHFVTSQNGSTVRLRNKIDVTMTEPAWDLYNHFESELLRSSFHRSDNDVLTPTMDRLAKSGLKAAILIAASRKEGGAVTVEERDMMKAFSYVGVWREYALDVLSHIGVNQSEFRIQLVHQMVKNSPGTTRGAVMRQYKLTSRDADSILETLEQRQYIHREKAGKGERLTAIN